MSFIPIIFLVIIVVLFWKSTSDPYPESEEAVHVVAKKKFSDMDKDEVRETIYGPVIALWKTAAIAGIIGFLVIMAIGVFFNFY